MSDWLLWTTFALAALPAVMTVANLLVLKPPPLPVAPPSIAILIPARNEAAAIGACVDAALASTGADIEVIVLDDGSSDGTGAIVEARAGATRACASPPRLPFRPAGTASSMPATSCPGSRAGPSCCSSTPTSASRPKAPPASPPAWRWAAPI